jgi:hypothetical protein
MREKKNYRFPALNKLGADSNTSMFQIWTHAVLEAKLRGTSGHHCKVKNNLMHVPALPEEGRRSLL